MGLKNAVETTLMRNAFYRDGYRMMLKISALQLIIIALLIASIISMAVSMETRFVYFATATDGRIIPLTPLNEPFRSRAEVIAWAASTAKSVLSFSYLDAKQRLQESYSKNNFTPTGWESFTRALKDARILETVEVRKNVISLEIEGAPEIKDAAVRDGIFTWYLQCPIMIRFEGPEPPAPIKAMLILKVVRVSTLQNPNGIGIEQWVAKLAN